MILFNFTALFHGDGLFPIHGIFAMITNFSFGPLTAIKTTIVSYHQTFPLEKT